MKGALRAIFILAMAGLTITLGVWFFQRAKGIPHSSAVWQREVATRVLGEYLARHHRGRPVLVVSNPFTQKRGLNSQIYAMAEAEIDGLRLGIGEAATIKVAFPGLRPAAQKNPKSVYVDPATTTPLSFLVAEESFDLLASENPDRSLVVSLIGLPANLSRVKVWNQEGEPQFALLLPDWRMVGNRSAVAAAFKSGKIVAAVVNKPGAAADDLTVSGNYEKEFAKRFLLLTSENIEAISGAIPHLFRKKPESQPGCLTSSTGSSRRGCRTHGMPLANPSG